jgi:NAD(P)-dependent dehydrogenase (short-subunit alcohol dehydrogenase family)
MSAFVGAFEEISDWNFREQLEVNFFGTANIIRTVLPGMRQRRSGHIINITGLSIDTLRMSLTVAGQIGTPSLSLLSAAHHAVEGYSEVSSRYSPELTVGSGIRSTAIQCKSLDRRASN